MIHKMISYYEKRNAGLQKGIDMLKENVEYFKNMASYNVKVANHFRHGAASPEFRKETVKIHFSRAAYLNNCARNCEKRVESLRAKMQENNHKIEALNEQTYNPYY